MSAKLDIIQALHDTIRAAQTEMEHLRRELFTKDEAIALRDGRIQWLNHRLDQQGNTYEYCLESAKQREAKLKEEIESLKSDSCGAAESFL